MKEASTLVEYRLVRSHPVVLFLRAAILAENLRRQLALFQERGVKSRRSTAAIRATMVLLSRCFASRQSDLGWERLADELKFKLGIRVSSRTVGKYLQRGRPSGGNKDQRWASFVRNQAKVIVACDFFVSVTLTIRVLYVFVAIAIRSFRLRWTQR